MEVRRETLTEWKEFKIMREKTMKNDRREQETKWCRGKKKEPDWVVVRSSAWLCDVRRVLTAPLVQRSPTWHFNTANCWSMSIFVCVCSRSWFEAEGNRERERESETEEKLRFFWGQFLWISMPLDNFVCWCPCEHVHVDARLNRHQNLILFLNSKQNRVELTCAAGVNGEGEDMCVCVSACVRMWQQPPCGET